MLLSSPENTWKDDLRACLSILETPSFWSDQATRIFSCGLCRTQNDDVGEVAAAFYLLYCGDSLRLEIDKKHNQFSVPFQTWMPLLRKETTKATHDTDGKVFERRRQLFCSYQTTEKQETEEGTECCKFRSHADGQLHPSTPQLFTISPEVFVREWTATGVVQGRTCDGCPALISLRHFVT